MTCPVCPEKMTYALIDVIHKACGPCQRQFKQMLGGFRGVPQVPKKKTSRWNNTVAYDEWRSQIVEGDLFRVAIDAKAEQVEQRCDIRDMKRVCGLPKFLPLERQVFTAWIVDGLKDERIQEVLGLNYSQLVHIKKVVKIRLQKQMAYYHEIKKLEKEGKSEPVN